MMPPPKDYLLIRPTDVHPIKMCGPSSRTAWAGLGGGGIVLIFIYFFTISLKIHIHLKVLQNMIPPLYEMTVEMLYHSTAT
jgi:hypothetical protein